MSFRKFHRAPKAEDCGALPLGVVGGGRLGNIISMPPALVREIGVRAGMSRSIYTLAILGIFVSVFGLAFAMSGPLVIATKVIAQFISTTTTEFIAPEIGGPDRHTPLVRNLRRFKPVQLENRVNVHEVRL